MIDLRSDTVTKPTPAMREAMTQAEVGDDVFREDPTVNKLEDKVAGMFGFEAGLFVPSGTMSNQLSINVLTDPGDEVLIEETGHIFNYESTAAAHLSSVQLHPLSGHRGKLSPQLLQDKIRGANDWDPNTTVVALENSTNKGGGCCYSEDGLEAIKSFVADHQLKIHLDGARIWNAITATGTDPAFFAGIADTMSVCFSKGLGAPVGSMMLSSHEYIAKARRMRKMWGGGMRQAGILAAAADHAIEEHWPLLKEDHRRARELGLVIQQCRGLAINLESVETNILIFDVKDSSAQEAVQRLEEEDIQVVPFGPQTVRATFHFEITDDDLERIIEVFENIYG